MRRLKRMTRRAVSARGARMEPRGVTLKRAGELIGGEQPRSVRTVSAMITRGVLEAYGARAGRRVTMRSIRAYQDGEPWQSERKSGASQAAGTLRMLPMRG